MGYANCGKDSQDRPIGYTVEAVCDHEGCDEVIDRGLSYACGGDHDFSTNTDHPMGESLSCDKYFCGQHLYMMLVPYSLDRKEPHLATLCSSCVKETEDMMSESPLDWIPASYDN